LATSRPLNTSPTGAAASQVANRQPGVHPGQVAEQEGRHLVRRRLAASDKEGDADKDKTQRE